MRFRTKAELLMSADSHMLQVKWVRTDLNMFSYYQVNVDFIVHFSALLVNSDSYICWELLQYDAL